MQPFLQPRCEASFSCCASTFRTLRQLEGRRLLKRYVVDHSKERITDTLAGCSLASSQPMTRARGMLRPWVIERESLTSAESHVIEHAFLTAREPRISSGPLYNIVHRPPIQIPLISLQSLRGSRLLPYSSRPSALRASRQGQSRSSSHLRARPFVPQP